MRILVVGLGDLGAKLAFGLAQALPAEHELVVAGRRPSVLEDWRTVALLAQHLANPGRRAVHLATRLVDLTQAESVAEMLYAVRPDVVLFTATRLSWWRAAELPEPTRRRLDGAGFAVWLPVHADLLLRYARVHRRVVPDAWLLVGPFPDATCPLLEQQGVRKLAGFGNVDEVAAKVHAEVAAALGRPAEVRVRIVAHHSVETRLFGAGPPYPPHRLEVRVDGRPWPEAGLGPPWPWPSGTASHHMTAASGVRATLALLGETPMAIHLPGPGGRVGGYPCLVSREGLRLDLDGFVTEAEAVAVNEEAQRYDGIEAIREGIVRLTPAATEALAASFGLAWTELAVDDMTERAEELVRRFEEARLP
jgi:hypothetical protein